MLNFAATTSLAGQTCQNYQSSQFLQQIAGGLGMRPCFSLLFEAINGQC